jgi:pimeloyl-ACP methyl ester carboxylesterase
MPTASSNGATIRYTTSGAGPAVLLIQGVGAIGRAWQPQIDALASSRTVLAFDNRGIGDSPPGTAPLSIEAMAADALAVADAVGTTTFDVVGHSMGGVIAQEVALSAPSRVRSLSLLCTFARGAQGARLSWDLLIAGLRSRLGPRTARRRAFVELVIPAAYLAQVDRAALEVELADLFGRDLADQPPIVMAQLKAMARYDALDRLRLLAPIPTLVVSATHDRIALPAFGRQLAAAIPGARCVEIADAGHAVPIQCADRVNALLAGHLAVAGS